MRNSKGQFTKGFSGNLNGRPKGIGKVYQERKEKLLALVESLEKEHLEEDIQKLSARDRMRLYVELHEYLIPKLQRSETALPVTVEELLSMHPDDQKAYILALRSQEHEN